jgi:hypothetical protein
LLFCNRYIVYRNKMLSSLAILNMNGVEINVDTCYSEMIFYQMKQIVKYF